MKLGEKLSLAQKGRLLWEGLEEKYPEKTLFLLLYDHALGEGIFPLLPEYLTAKGYDRAVMLSLEEELSLEQIDCPVSTEILSPEEGEALLTLYEMYQFTPSLAIVSLERPHGRKLSNLQGIVPLEEIVKTCLFSP